MDALPALAEMVEAGATAAGDDKNSVAAAAMLAIDLAVEGGVEIESARMVVIDFDESGDVSVYSVPDGASAKVRESLSGDGIVSGTVSADDVKRAFDEAARVEGEE